MALSANASFPAYEGVAAGLPQLEELPVKASVHIYAGAMIGPDANGRMAPASSSIRPTHRAEEEADNSSGGEGAITVKCRRGVFRYKNNDSIAAANRYQSCYCVDDFTVAKSDNSDARVLAGTIVDVDSVGVWVHLGMPSPYAAVQVGTATLVAGVATVSSKHITANSTILVTMNTPGGTLGTWGYKVADADVTAGVGSGSFVIRSINEDKTAATSDTSTVNYLIVN
jgi:hypothetical protein